MDALRLLLARGAHNMANLFVSFVNEPAVVYHKTNSRSAGDRVGGWLAKWFG